MAVYYKDNPAFLKLALASIAAQSINEFEVVIVKDGELTPELDQVLVEFEKNLMMVVIELPSQRGLNHALNAGLQSCRYDIILRCDADDINLPNRFFKQFDFLNKNPDVALVGTQVIEFVQNASSISLGNCRSVPLTDAEIRCFSKFRSPFNHPSVAYRKSAVIRAGRYSEATKTKLEDYGLWLRMLGLGFKGANLNEALVLFRAGESMISRRRGFSYFLDELLFIPEKVESGLVGYPEAIAIGVPRALLRCFNSSSLHFLYRNFLRQRLEVNIFDDKELHKLGIRVKR